jgi:hypothetical protein
MARRKNPGSLGNDQKFQRSRESSRAIGKLWMPPLTHEMPITHDTQGMFVKYIQQETGTRVQIKGQGSGFVDQETGRESDEPMHIHITCVTLICLLHLDISAIRSTLNCFIILLTLPPKCSGPDDTQVARAKALTDDLLSVVRSEHAKMQAILHQQQMELHNAQAQYAQYAAIGV